MYPEYRVLILEWKYSPFAVTDWERFFFRIRSSFDKRLQSIYTSNDSSHPGNTVIDRSHLINFSVFPVWAGNLYLAYVQEIWFFTSFVTKLTNQNVVWIYALWPYENNFFWRLDTLIYLIIYKHPSKREFRKVNKNDSYIKSLIGNKAGGCRRGQPKCCWIPVIQTESLV